MQCPLCFSNTNLFSKVHQRTYHRCDNCDAIFLDRTFQLPPDQEKQRYLLHHNDVNDSGYQKFVSPIVEAVFKEQKPKSYGLDFGSGSGPVITKLLRDAQYTITTYDPIFDPNTTALLHKYEYITCCEVIEHFYNPAQEFELLSSLLQKQGTLYCKTHLFNSSLTFDSWWYKNDPTHVFFYTKKTLQWITQQFGFLEVVFYKDLIILRK